MFVLIPGSIPLVRFGPVVTDPAEISIPAVTCTMYIVQCTLYISEHISGLRMGLALTRFLTINVETLSLKGLFTKNLRFWSRFR